MPRLVLETKDGPRVVELQTWNSLGRHPSNTIQLLDKIVSKEHCTIERRQHGFVLRDLGSLNGTYINATRVNGERDLANGDEISLGQTKARYEDVLAAQAPHAVPHGAPHGQPNSWPPPAAYGATNPPIAPPPASVPGARSFAPGDGAPTSQRVPGHPSGAQAAVPQGGYPSAAAIAGGAHLGQQMPGQPYSGQAHLGQQMPGQPHSGQPQSGQGYPGQQMPGQPYSGQPMPGQPMPGQLQAGQPQAGQAFHSGMMPAVKHPGGFPAVNPASAAAHGAQYPGGPPGGAMQAPSHGGAVPGARPSQPQRPPVPPPSLPQRGAMRTFHTAFLPAMPTGKTNVDADDAARPIGAEFTATERDFRPFDEIALSPQQLRADYERLRLSYELTRDIAFEKDTAILLEKILRSMFRFTHAQRGVIFLQDLNGEMKPMATHRADGGSGAISVSTTILKKVVAERKAVLTHDAAMDFAASKGKSMILNQIHSAIVCPMLHGETLFGVLWLDSQSLAQFQPKDLELVSSVANQAAMFLEINILGRTKDQLSRFVSPNVAEQVINRGVDVNPGGQRAECTVYNSDIRGFTRMSERSSPEELVEMLNAYFEDMVDVIFKYEGTLDKFMGDGIMAVWGAPVSHDDDPVRAVECSIEQLEVLGNFNRERVARGSEPLGVGTAVHTGPVVAGYIGTKRALSYTVIGDVANTSARLCGSATAGQIIVSETTRARLDGRFEVEELAPVKLRGKEHELRVFNVVRLRPAVVVPGFLTPAQGFDLAIGNESTGQVHR